jgi:hypothetical protein
MAIWGCERYVWIHVLVRYQGYPASWVVMNKGSFATVLSSELVCYSIAHQLGWELIRNVLGRKSDEQPHGNASSPRGSWLHISLRPWGFGLASSSAGYYLITSTVLRLRDGFWLLSDRIREKLYC